jgi:hypothetical protein
MGKSKNGFTKQSMEISFGHPERERITFSIPYDISEQLKKSSDQSVTAQVQIRAGGFTGYADLWLDVSDFARFAPEVQRLYETLKGEARFETIENQISLVLKGDGKGHINLSGRLLGRCGDGNELLFKLDLDQTQLKHPISELEQFLKQATNRL